MYRIFTNAKGESRIIAIAHIVSIVLAVLNDDEQRGDYAVVDINTYRWVFTKTSGPWSLADALKEISNEK